MFLIAGETGANMMNKIFGPQFPIDFRGQAKLGKSLVWSIEHPSRTSYDYFSQTIGDISKALKVPQ